MSQPPLGFIPEPITVLLDRILPSRKPPNGILESKKFKTILSSIEEVGLIEPLTLSKADAKTAQHVLLDGHIRVLALRQLEFVDAPCFVALDDENYTYNNRINRLSTIQEHFMIRRAVDRGVSPERLAKALCVDVSHIVKKMNLLEGLCQEVTELLKDQQFSPNLGAVLRKMKPTRQIECVELMLAANNVTVAYGQALLVATPPEMLIGEVKPKKMAGVTSEQMARMEREMGNVHGQFKLIEQSYGQDVLNLVLAKGYIAKLLENDAVMRFLAKNRPDMLAEFEDIAQTVSLDK
ncbi:plasmid partitioning protein RepB C-terminal domain-containing protein [Burkholderia cepacia]|uniref:plasmid partitioning protein RepB C-terminal domain-containing protein n=1 Tax=Burkholderia cepacia TaxID=292 RepID=UPI001CF551AA|nr:plasmid partitioning protein RepB C-terminal domain-containing protein [Burkholderia cepacia]MCA8349949.1 ParB N-terminal domain-containing protein [Burkholderia cepacia]